MSLGYNRSMSLSTNSSSNSTESEEGKESEEGRGSEDETEEDTEEDTEGSETEVNLQDPNLNITTQILERDFQELESQYRPTEENIILREQNESRQTEYQKDELSIEPGCELDIKFREYITNFRKVPLHDVTDELQIHLGSLNYEQLLADVNYKFYDPIVMKGIMCIFNAIKYNDDDSELQSSQRIKYNLNNLKQIGS